MWHPVFCIPLVVSRARATLRLPPSLLVFRGARLGRGKEGRRERETERERLRVCSHGRPPHFLTYILTSLARPDHTHTPLTHLFPPAPQPQPTQAKKKDHPPARCPSHLLPLAPLPSCQGRRGHGDTHHQLAHRGLLQHGPPPRSPQAGVFWPPGGRRLLATPSPGAGSRKHAPCEPCSGPTRQCATPSSGTGRCGRGL